MTFTTAALALYHRAKAQYRVLTNPAAALAADHNHHQRPLHVVFAVHRSQAPRRRPRPRLLTTAIRRLLADRAPAPQTPSPPVAKKPPCRLCAAVVHPSPQSPSSRGGTRAISPHHP
ncbi:hypothetical protein G7043_19000 [Lentzea sp. NEAU-D13]|uniref:Uncharacterized protein n=1 Tax=Lentzea alba TaxID=2714351 RepID=A0A7C9RSN4_9PSEU|nr:hypothetical protein [Lentzea alba]NGY61023.1 hypothetical protein [Lentzea alba]